MSFKVTFVGAKTALMYYQKSTNSIVRLKGDLKSIGGIQKEGRRFHNQTAELSKGDVLYLATDGFVDQANPKRRKFGSKTFIQLLQDIASQPMETQREKLTAALQAHQETAAQRDDITVMGIKM